MKRLALKENEVKFVFIGAYKTFVIHVMEELLYIEEAEDKKICNRLHSINRQHIVKLLKKFNKVTSS